MPDATPAAETVIAAVKAEIDAVNPAWGTVLDSDNPIAEGEGEIEFIEQYQMPVADPNEGAIDLWVVSKEGGAQREGDAPGQVYEFPRIFLQYWGVRLADASWDKTARAQIAAVLNRLSQNSANIFRIGGQIQLETPETVTVARQGFETVGGQHVYKARLELTYEARRWA